MERFGRGDTARRRAGEVRPAPAAGAAGMRRRDAFDGVLAALHEATLDDARWPEASRLIDEVCGIKGNMLVYGSGASHDDVAIYLARLYYRGERNEEFERKYFEEYYAQDERVPRFRTLADSRLVHASDLYTDEEKKTSAAYNEALPLSDTLNCLSVRLDGPNRTRIVWSFADPVEPGGWAFDQIDTIERLLPHLRQYVRMRQVLADAHGLKASLAALLDNSAIGVIQLNRRGRIVAANDRASDRLKRRDGVFDAGGFLGARAPADNDKLQGLLARAIPASGGQGVGGSMAVSRPLELWHAVLHVIPVGRRDGDVPPWEVAALVLVVDPYSRLPVDRVLVEAALGLSPAESRVAVLLAEGRTVREVAASTGRSENTIRWHVRQIFAKQGITRLDQLLALVRSLAGVSGSSN